MKTSMIAASILATDAAAQKYIYTTRTVTECFSTTPTSFGPPKPTQGPDSAWTITIPECKDCGCKERTFTHEYTATFDVFYPNGTAKWEYPIKELYPGMSTLPEMPTPTLFPYGFITSLRSCRICGDEPVSATMTYPRGALPYRQSIPVRNEALETDAPEATITSESSISPVSTSTMARETGILEKSHGEDGAKEETALTVRRGDSTVGTATRKRASRMNRSNYRSYGISEERGTDLDRISEESSTTLASATPPKQRTTPRSTEDTLKEGGVNRRVNGPGAALILPLALMI